MVVVTIPATREGRGPWTWWARKRTDRARRLAARPVATAEERYARGISWRRIVGVVLHALPRRRRRRAPRFVTPGEPIIPGAAPLSAEGRARTAAARTAADGQARPLREKVDERSYVAQVEAQADVANEIVVMVKKLIPMPEVIEPDPIDTDIVNPRILTRS